MSNRNISDSLIGMCIDCDSDVYMTTSNEIPQGSEIYCALSDCENHAGTHIGGEDPLPEWVDKD